MATIQHGGGEINSEGGISMKKRFERYDVSRIGLHGHRWIGEIG